MKVLPTDAGTDAPVERFKPTSGLYIGAVGIVGALVAIGYVAWSAHTIGGLRLACGAAFAAIVIWDTQMRPRATAYQDRLVLKNMVTDIQIPYGAIEDVAIAQSLVVWAAGKRYLCVGIGNKLRQELNTKRRKMKGTLGSSRWHEFAEMADKAAPEQRDTTYQSFVVTRIVELIDQYRLHHGGEPVPPVDRRLVVWPILGLVVTGVAFLVTLFVG